MSDEQEDSQTVQEMVEERESIVALIRSAGWDWVKNVLEDKLQALRNEAELTPLKSIDETLAQEFHKGRMANIRETLGLPYSRLEELDNIIEAYRQQQGEEKDGEGSEQQDFEP